VSRRPPLASAKRRPARGDEASFVAPTAAPARHRRRAAKVAVAALLGVSVIVAGGEWVLRLGYFRVQHVTVVGLHHEPRSAVLAASGLASHPPMIDVSAASVDSKLASFVWIKDVRVSRRWPNSVVVTVRERVPVAVAFDARHRLHFVDAAGRELGVAPLHANLPTLEYVRPKNATWPFARAGRAAAYVASRLPPAFASQVSVVSVDAAGSVSLRLTTPVSFILGPPRDLAAKFVSIASVIAHSRLSPGDVVDVSVPGALAVTGGPPSS
jgi:cell division protein FtsQ